MGSKWSRGGSVLCRPMVSVRFVVGITLMRIRIHIKGTVSRDFLLLVFFMNEFPLSPRVFHLDRFEFFENSRGDIRKSRCTTGINEPVGETDSRKKPEAKNLVTLSL